MDKIKEKEVGCLFKSLVYKPLPSLTQCQPEESKPIVDGILYENDYLVLHGFKETYKSWTAARLAISVASDIDFFGHKVIKTGKIVYIYGEGKMIRRFQWLCKGLGIPFPENIIPYKLRADLTKQEVLKDLKQHIPEGTVLIIIDNYEKYWWSNTDEKIVDSALRFIFEAKEYTALLLVQHQPKAAKNKSHGHENAIGNIRMANSADATIELRRKKQTVHAHFYHREEEAKEDIAFQLVRRSPDAFVLEKTDEDPSQGQGAEDGYWERLIQESSQRLTSHKDGKLYSKSRICNEFLDGVGISNGKIYNKLFPSLKERGIVKVAGNKFEILPDASE